MCERVIERQDGHRTGQQGAQEVLSAEETLQGLVFWFPSIGFLLGIAMWMVDAAVDAWLIETDKSFAAAVWSDEPTEVWMRSLVVVMMTGTAFFAQYLLRKQQHTEQLLRDHKGNLEAEVAARTAELEHIANIDPLTQVYNRRKMHELMAHELQRAARYQLPLSFVMCDIDHFKRINDNYGHEEGDRVLQQVASLFRECLRTNDVLARWGGEEFVILLPHTDLQAAEGVAEKLRQRFTELTYGDAGESVTASFGVSQLLENEAPSPLVKRADNALYRAKHGGRNRVCIDH